jgi:hypothetical protein
MLSRFVCQLLGYMRAYFHLPYRQTEGMVIAHAKSMQHCNKLNNNNR